MFSIIKKYRTIMNKKQRSRIFILFIIILINSVMEVMGVALMLPICSAIMNPNIIEENQVVSRICDIFDLHSHRTFAVVCLIALIAIYILKNLFYMLQNYAQARFVANNRLATQKQILHVFFSKPYEFFLNAKSGEILRIINSDVSQVYGLLKTLLQLLTDLIISFALLVTTFLVDPLLMSVVAIVLGILVATIAMFIKPVLAKHGIENKKNSASATGWLVQSINGIKEIKVTKKEKYFEDNFNYYGSKAVESDKIFSVVNGLPRSLIETVSICAILFIIIIMIIGGRDMQSLVVTLGAFAMAATKLLPSAYHIVSTIGVVAYQKSSLDRLIEEYEWIQQEKKLKKEEITENDAPIPFKMEDKICLKNITYHYPNNEKNVLEDACMEIPIGKSVGIVGRSGSGKTTSVDILLGLLKPQSGLIEVDGKNIYTDYAGWLENIGYIPQTIFLIDSSIRENVAFGINKEKVDEEQLWKAIDEAQLGEFVRELPEGLDTQIGERGVRLSGGQRQRIGIARALYSNPKLLVFDEATSSLDNETEEAIMEAINNLHGKKTMIIIAHRLQTIEKCDIVYRVKDNKIVKAD